MVPVGLECLFKHFNSELQFTGIAGVEVYRIVSHLI